MNMKLSKTKNPEQLPFGYPLTVKRRKGVCDNTTLIQTIFQEKLSGDEARSLWRSNKTYLSYRDVTIGIAAVTVLCILKSGVKDETKQTKEE